jgi:hypothetical protein
VLEVCRDAVGDIRGVLAELPTRVEREPVLAQGEGGDDTTAIDAAAETAVVHRLEQLDQDFTLVSEELGERVFGTGTPWRVVCDPIDGSLNAKRNIPFYSLSLAVADGDTMGDVVFGYVYDFGTGEEWTASGGRCVPERLALGACGRRTRSRSSRSRRPPPRRSRTRPRRWSARAHRLRDHGLARHLALPPRRRPRRRRLLAQACALGRHRSRPAARARVRPRDRAVRGPPFESAPLDLVGRSRVVAAGTTELCRTLEASLTA